MRSRWMVGGLLLLALGFGAGLIYLLFFAGSEPPIRVRNGSMDFVLCDGSEWQEQFGNGRKHWSPPRGKGRGHLWVTVAAESGDTQCQNGVYDASRIRFYYSDDTKNDRVQMLSANRTQLVPREVLSKPGANPNIVQYKAGANDEDRYISGVDIQLRGSEQHIRCTFSDKNALEYIDICSGKDATACGSCNR